MIGKTYRSGQHASQLGFSVCLGILFCFVLFFWRDESGAESERENTCSNSFIKKHAKQTKVG
jgi:hypothetical protein